MDREILHKEDRSKGRDVKAINIATRQDKQKREQSNVGETGDGREAVQYIGEAGKQV
jgi:hypothetical protein